MPKRTKQKPTLRPHAPHLPKPPPAPRRGTLPLTAFERRIFLEMAGENDRLRAAQQQLTQQSIALAQKHNQLVRALGDTHGMDFVLCVELNEAKDAVNWREIVDETQGGNVQ